MHHTKYKGDSAVALTILDLTRKGYFVSQPLSEHAPYDLLCDTGTNIYKIQVKYRSSGKLPVKNTWTDKTGTHSKFYTEKSFDYFALVFGNFDKICYPPFDMKGLTLKENHPKNYYGKYYFWKDFIDFTMKIPDQRQIFANGKTLNDVSYEEFEAIYKESKNNKEVYESLGITRKMYTSLLEKYQLKAF